MDNWKSYRANPHARQVCTACCERAVRARHDACRADHPFAAQGSLTQPSPRVFDTAPVRVLSPESPAMAYRRRKGEMKTVVHWGQRKLLMSEIEFLTLYSRPGQTVVYAGAAPGSHTNYLSDLFPHLKFVLVDPNGFSAWPTDRVVIRQEFFTDDTAREYAGQGVLFISDIRTAEWTSLTDQEVEEHVWRDMCDQQRWHLLIQAERSMLKFRLPWKPGTKTLYLAGQVFLPVWGPQTTTECRLVTSGGFCAWDNTLYESQLFYFNTHTRVSLYPHDVHCPGSDHCFDCTSEMLILRQYLTKYKHMWLSEFQARGSDAVSRAGSKGSRVSAGAARERADSLTPAKGCCSGDDGAAGGHDAARAPPPDITTPEAADAVAVASACDAADVADTTEAADAADPAEAVELADMASTVNVADAAAGAAVTAEATAAAPVGVDRAGAVDGAAAPLVTPAPDHAGAAAPSAPADTPAVPSQSATVELVSSPMEVAAPDAGAPAATEPAEAADESLADWARRNGCQYVFTEAERIPVSELRPSYAPYQHALWATDEEVPEAVLNRRIGKMMEELSRAISRTRTLVNPDIPITAKRGIRVTSVLRQDILARRQEAQGGEAEWVREPRADDDRRPGGKRKRDASDDADGAYGSSSSHRHGGGRDHSRDSRRDSGGFGGRYRDGDDDSRRKRRRSRSPRDDSRRSRWDRPSNSQSRRNRRR